MSRHDTAKSVVTKGRPRRGVGGRGTVAALIRGGLSGCRDRVACRTGRAEGNDRVDPTGVSRGRGTGGESVRREGAEHQARRNSRGSWGGRCPQPTHLVGTHRRPGG